MNRCPAIFLFDWGDTLMRDDPNQVSTMSQWPIVTAMPGAKKTLVWARQRGQVGIATGAMDSDENEIRAALARVDLDNCIDFIFCRRALGFGKTDSRFWQHLLSTLQTPPEKIVMIGDSYVADVAAPQAAGLNAVWFNWRKEAPQPCLTITALQELPGLFC